MIAVRETKLSTETKVNKKKGQLARSIKHQQNEHNGQRKCAVNTSLGSSPPSLIRLAASVKYPSAM